MHLNKGYEQWTVALTEQEELWERRVFDEHSAIVAHEYDRIHQLLTQNQSYGVVLQIKDLFEVLLKWPVLITISRIFQKKEYAPKEIQLLVKILEKPLSLGDWESIARSIKTLENIPPNLQQLLEQTLTFFNKNGLVNWRNEKIGHGALAFDHNDEFREDIKQKLKIIKQFFCDTYPLAQSIEFHLKTDNEQHKLHGKDILQKLSQVDGELGITIENESFSLSPFILKEGSEIYFFDTFYARKQKAAILDYTQGKKSYNSDLSERLSNKQRELSFAMRSTGTINDQTYSLLEIALLDKLSEVDDYVSPDYLKNTVRDWLDHYEQGLFLMQMERGTGKTTFSRALDELSIHKYQKDFQNESMRAFYVNDSYSYSVDYFSQIVQDTLKKNEKGMPEIVMMGQMTGKEENPAASFADMLGKFAEAHQRHFVSKEKLVLIIDGIDEIPAQSGKTMFDFISHELPPNVYVILTCRTTPELTDYTKAKIARLTFTDQVTYARDTEQNIEALKQYIQNKIFKQHAKLGLNEQHLNQILQKADYRFLYLKFTKELLLANSLVNPFNELPDGEQLIEYYITHLQNMYGDKYFRQITAILSILATAKQGLTFREISDLLHEDNPTFRFLAYLIDVRVFLKVERSYRGNLIYIAHEELKRWVLQAYNAPIQAIVHGWNGLVEGMVTNNRQLEWETPDCDGEIYLLTTIHAYNEEYPTVVWTNEQQQAFKEYTSQINQYFENKTLIDYQSQRRIKLLENQLAYADLANLEEAKTKGKIGQIQHFLMNYEEALLQFEEAINLLSSNDANCEELTTLYFYKGQTLRRTGYFTEAIGYFDKAQQVYEQLENDTPAIRTLYAETIKERAYTKALTEAYEDALVDYNLAASLLEPYVDDIPEYNYVLAMIVTNRGATYAALQEQQKSIADFERGTAIRRTLFEQNAMPDPSLLASSLMNLGNVYTQNQRAAEGLSLCKEAVDLCLELKDLGQLPNLDYISTALIFRGNCYTELNELTLAEADYSLAVETRKDLFQQNKLPRIHSLIHAFEVRANFYKAQQQLTLALADYQTALVYVQRGKDKGLFIEDMKEQQLVEDIGVVERLQTD